MDTDAGPTLSQVLDWLDEGARLTAAERGSQARPEHVVWTMLGREVAAMVSRDQALDTKRATWVLTWLRYMRYRGANPAGVRKAALAVAGGAKSKAVAHLVGRARGEFDRRRLMDFKARMAALVLEGLIDDYGIGPVPGELGFGFLTARAG